MAGSAPFLPLREHPYRITRTVPIAGGKTFLIEPGACIVWSGILENGDRPVAVFEAVGDDVTLAVAGEGEAVVQCATPSMWVYALAMHGCRGLRVKGIRARDCQHVWVGASVLEYGAVVTRGPDSNIARDVLISGGGAWFKDLLPGGNGACLLSYVAGARVSNADYTNVSHGVQWWGGDAGLLPGQNGERGNERKCSDLLVERVSVHNARIAGIWGVDGSPGDGARLPGRGMSGCRL